ncbi:MAG: PEP-CTERM sorting domain-containing protein [Verrucomicrobia bacterium]|nr:PEP-CTERM sorting domain-containing protein [Verrucomicrobiota bacterium]MCH8511622.1 PEP-CTERM sorting domain-containing protein [Kiritimatiellia bacterium]
MKTKTTLFTLCLVALMAHVSVMGTLVISEDFTTNTTGNWSFLGESTVDNAGNIAYHGAGTSWGYGPHDGVMRWRPNHTGTSSNQASLIFRELASGTEDASDYTLSTTGIHANNGNVDIRLAIQYFEDDTTKWAVTNQSIRTSSGGNQAPVPGSWDFSIFTFSSLDTNNLLAGGGSSVTTSTVLENATGIGVYSRFSGQQWMADNATQINSITVIPEPGSLLLVVLGFGACVVFLCRRR